ncbi:MAG: hypothetical protein MI754_12895 [Chromatiales bacterium]|nr:hypothetical protein [Chromatiales bacterium]
MRRAIFWLSQHLVLLIVLIFVVVGVLFRQEIFGIKQQISVITEQPVREEPVVTKQQVVGLEEPEPHVEPETPQPVSEREPEVSQSAEEPATPDPARAARIVEETENQAADVNEAESVSAAGQEDAVVVAETTQMPMNGGDEASLPTTEVIATEPVLSDSQPPSSLTPIELQAQSMVFRPLEQNQPTEPPQGGQEGGVSSSDTGVAGLLDSAREAYWMGSEGLAIERYRQIIAAYPDNIDSYGELGNIHLKQGDAEAAFLVYSRAIELLKQRGATDEATQFISTVRSFDRELGKRLQLNSGAPK